ncbi:MAG TPA: AraC family transcriptional regulator [Zoogloea sp.]|uniref:AraC family transcriptional regulator n=2 Tax=Zoogloea sp. TaxID=49181 RepID=UPI002C8ADFF3|nr:AraC family transcriptional regulator [Zoogloea sp.]HMV18156.1 AraC family transcriptional regulator [Rhodocyclaceae bacterium]HMV64072.1 AraC family transcriptional regulator [Rhodocyclaceae bacterium]HMW52618.1 AraC family transcriptional regulator [Rhodocyclaceae bacterium]HMY50112.1 AraC family transcriptional regulator [Rhodocyclaceae bacterium]HMZ76687.1 AraC family transcriptional regulator [Rhodocyclaceae bacterium]
MPMSSSSAAPAPSPAAPERRRASVAMGFVTGMVAGMQRRGHDPAPLLAATDIDLADSASRIPLDRYAALYNRVIRDLDDEGFGLFERPLGTGSFEFLCRGMLGAPHLAEALERARRFLHIVLPDLAVSIHRLDSHAELRIAETRPLCPTRDDPARVFAFEWLLRLLHGLACWLVGRGLALDAVRFPFARPPHADDYQLIYTAHFSFGGDDLAARFNPTLLDLPIRRDEAALARFLEGAPGKITTLYRRDRDTVVRVRDLLRAALPANLSQEHVADRLHLSPRTLHRRLDEEGSSFRAIKEALRRDIAVARLTKTRHSIARVAADLGYADTSAFYRAFIAWTGLSPERYRKQLAAQAPAQSAP